MKINRLFTGFLRGCLIAGAGFSLYASAQINFGLVDIGGTATQAVTVHLPTAVTLNGIAVRTEGAESLDFTNAGGGTCAIGTTYAKGATCTVKVTFKPGYAGSRNGAAVLESSSGTAATTYLQGTGVGSEPRIAFLPGAQTTIMSPAPDVDSAAVDGSGNVYLADESYPTFVTVPPSEAGSVSVVLPSGQYADITVGSGFGSPAGIAVDGSGNVYIADYGFYTVYRAADHSITTYIPPNVYKETLEPDGSYTQSTIGSNWNSPSGVAVDGSGNVYITETGIPVHGGDTISPVVYKETLQSDGSYTQSTIGSGWSGPIAIATDGHGSVYVADTGTDSDSSAVYKLAPSGSSYTKTDIVNGLSGSLAVDGNGNLFISDGVVYKETLLSNGTYAQSVAATAEFESSGGLAVDASGTLYLCYPFSYHLSSAPQGTLNKIAPSDPPALSFAATVIGSTSKDSPQTVTISNVGDGALTFTELSYPTDFPKAAGVANACTSSTSLEPSESCIVALDFKPITSLGGKSSVALSESVKITTNGLNGNADAQAIPVSGTELSQ